MSKRSIGEFETVHGGSRIKALQHQLEVEQAKVEALADVQNKVSIIKTPGTVIRFGITSDRHYGSLYHNENALAAFYEHCQKEGIQSIYDAGDMLDGHRVYKGQEFELRDLGFDAQVKRASSIAPRGIDTEFITGNHDASFKNAAGVHVGKGIESAVHGYKFIGEEQARVRWETPNGPFELMLMHPGGGSSYAISYKAQKIVESLEGGTKPDMLVIGHFHKADFIPSYRNVALIQAGTFENQTPFMARQGIAAHVGGWIVEVHVGKGHKCIKAEFIAFYE